MLLKSRDEGMWFYHKAPWRFLYVDSKYTNYKVTDAKRLSLVIHVAILPRKLFGAFSLKRFHGWGLFLETRLGPHIGGHIFRKRPQCQLWSEEIILKAMLSSKTLPPQPNWGLMLIYGKMDILWLDGGWVRPFSTIDQISVVAKTILMKPKTLKPWQNCGNGT